jgi:hypothetical protein
MAGTAAGIAKCNAAREAKRAARAAAAAAATVEPQQSAVGGPLVALDVGQEVVRSIPNGVNSLARLTLDDGAADAAGYLVRIVRKGGVPHRLRFECAAKILDLTVGRKQSGTVEPDDNRMAGILDRVASSLALRRSAATATDAPVIGEESGDTL